jgi:hypothetical protein
MKHITLIPFLLVIGCTTLPVSPVWPTAPAELKKSCPSLQEVKEGTTKLSEVLAVVVDNYSQYHVCQAKVDAWIEWHTAQKKIHEKLR